MRPGPRIAIKGVGLALAGLTVLGTTFTLGVVAGAGSATEPHAPTAGVLDDAASEIADSSLLAVDRGELDAAAIQAMLAVAGDRWGSWGDPASATSTAGYAGVGLLLRRDGVALVVSQVALRSPAASSSIEVGDELRAVGDRPTRGFAASEVAAWLRGRPGTTVSLVLRRGPSLRSLTLTRAEVAAVGVSRSMVSSQVGRIVVPAFTLGVGRGVREAVATLRARRATGIVLDLRGDPGGLLSEAVETASAFLDGGHVVTYTRRDEQPQRLDAIGSGDTRTPLVVLVDGGTASAAEVVAGALQDRGRAVVVGSRTFGKGSVQEPHHLQGGSSLALTVARYALPSGRSVEGVGIEPDIEVSVRGDTDLAMSRAVEVLAGLLADSGGGRG